MAEEERNQQSESDRLPDGSPNSNPATEQSSALQNSSTQTIGVPGEEDQGSSVQMSNNIDAASLSFDNVNNAEEQQLQSVSAGITGLSNISTGEEKPSADQNSSTRSFPHGQTNEVFETSNLLLSFEPMRSLNPESQYPQHIPQVHSVVKIREEATFHAEAGGAEKQEKRQSPHDANQGKPINDYLQV